MKEKREVPMIRVSGSLILKATPDTPRGENKNGFSLNGNPRRKKEAYGKPRA